MDVAGEEGGNPGDEAAEDEEPLGLCAKRGRGGRIEDGDADMEEVESRVSILAGFAARLVCFGFCTHSPAGDIERSCSHPPTEDAASLLAFVPFFFLRGAVTSSSSSPALRYTVSRRTIEFVTFLAGLGK